MLHIVQNASGLEYERQAAVTSEWHQAYADRHGYTYRLSRNAPVDGRHPWWTKISTLRALLDGLTEDDQVLWLDLDCVVKMAHIDFKLDEVLGDAELSLVRYLPMIKRVWNTGVIFMRPTNAVKKLFDAVDARGPIDSTMNDAAGDEPVINDELTKWLVKVMELDTRFNSFGWVKPSTQSVVIRSFHGETQKANIPGLLAQAMRIPNF